MLKMTLIAAGFAAAAISAPLAANAVTYDFNSLGNYSGSFSLDVSGGFATDGSGTINIPGDAPEALTLVTSATPGVYGGDIFGSNGGDNLEFDNAVPIDSIGYVFAIGPAGDLNRDTNALITFYSNGDGTDGAALFGFVNGTRYYQNSGEPVTLTATSAAPEPGTWALMFGGLAMIGGMLRIANARRRENEVAGIATA